MIYITGDCHRNFTRLNKHNFPEQEQMTKDDYVIVLGDFGLIWDKELSKEESYLIKWLENKPFTTLFVDGNHENHERLKTYPIEEWNGGKIHKISPSIFHLMRGEIFTLQGKTFFAFGGAQSHDITDGILEPDNISLIKEYQKEYRCFRVNHVSWWKEELPSESEMNHGLENLLKYHNKVDYILSHCCPHQIASIIHPCTPDILTTYFDKINESVHCHKWFFGHYHDDRSIMGKYQLRYVFIEEIETNKTKASSFCMERE